MSEIKWIETKKEYEVDVTGKAVLKKFTSEPKKGFEKKDILDLIFRSVALIAIGLPIYMVSLQQRATIQTQRITQQSDIFVNTSTEIRSILTNSVNSTQYQKSRDRLYNELSPKIAFLFSSAISEKMEEINANLPFYELIVNSTQIETSLYDYEKVLGSYLSSYAGDSFGPEKIDQAHEEEKVVLDSLFQNFLEIKGKIAIATQNLSSNNDDFKMYLQQIDSSYKVAFSFHSRFKPKCDAAMQIIKAGTLGNNDGSAQLLALQKEHTELLRIGPQLHQFAIIRNDFYNRLKLKCHEVLTDMRNSNKLLDR